MAYRPVALIEVRAWGRTVGAVALDDAVGFYRFEYDRAWQRHGVELAPLYVPTRGRTFAFPQLPEQTYHRLPAFLADALPDAFGNALVDAQLAREGVSLRQVTPLDRLGYLGSRAMGALEFRPSIPLSTPAPTAIVLSDLVVAARAAVNGTLGHDGATGALQQLLAVGTSAGGARAKAVVAWNPATDELRSGQLDVDDGFEHWLLKFDGVGTDHELGTSEDYGRIEFAYHQMAQAAGIDLPDARLLHEGERSHFMVRRFDRAGNERIHIQTLCAMAHLDFNQNRVHDYAQLFQTIDELGLDRHERTEAFRRMAFNVAAANRDDHTKNISFRMDRAGAWSLAPAYDVTHAYNPAGQWTAAHQMAVGGRRDGITKEDLLLLADRFAVPAARSALDDVLSAVNRWPEFADGAELSGATARTIADDLAAVAPR